MREIKQYQADDGSIWPTEQAAHDHERSIRGERAARTEIAYVVAEVNGDWRAWKRVGDCIEALKRGRNEYWFTEAADAYELVLKDVGYCVPACYVDSEERPDFPNFADFEQVADAESARP